MATIVCSAEKACELMKHIDKDKVVILTVIDEKTYIHSIPKKIQKEKSEELINQADNIFYQDNDFFGTLSLYGVLKEKDVIHNLLFPQLE